MFVRINYSRPEYYKVSQNKTSFKGGVGRGEDGGGEERKG